MILSSAKILKLFSDIKFNSIVLFRSFILLFSRNKSIELIQLDTHTEYIFEKSYFSIAYKFRNAIWYEFKGLKSTTDDSLMVFDRSNVGNPIVLIVHGFGNKSEYEFEITPDHKLYNASFVTKLNNLTNLDFKSSTLICVPYNLQMEYDMISCKVNIKDKCNVRLDMNLSIKNQPIKINYSSFNKSDYL